MRMNFSSNNLWIIFCKKYFLIILLSRIFSIVLFLIQCSRLKIDIVRLGLTSQQLLNLSFTPKQLRLCSYLAYTRWCWSEVEAMAMVPALSGSGIILWSLSCLAGLPFKPSCFLEFPDGDFMGTMNNHCILEIPCGELMDALHCILQFPTGELMHPMHCIGCTNSPSGNPKNKLCASSTLWPGGHHENFIKL